MEIIVPAAGLSTRFPNTKPKYMLTDFTGEMMIQKTLSNWVGAYNITIGVLQEHWEQYDAVHHIRQAFGELVKIVVLPERTKGPADTVYQILKTGSIDPDTAIFIKDCDSFFDYDIHEGNYICVSDVKNHTVLSRLAEKSFVVANDQGIIDSIVEKQVVSNKFCVGGYGFAYASHYMKYYETLDTDQEIFVSHVIDTAILDGKIFTEAPVTSYVDVGTITEWAEYNHKEVACK